MKKIVVILTLLIMSFTLVSCLGGEHDNQLNKDDYIFAVALRNGVDTYPQITIKSGVTLKKVSDVDYITDNGVEVSRLRHFYSGYFTVTYGDETKVTKTMIPVYIAYTNYHYVRFKDINMFNLKIDTEGVIK